MRIRLAFVSVSVLMLGLALVAVPGCGEDAPEAETERTGRWAHARLAGIRAATALASLEGRLLVATSGSPSASASLRKSGWALERLCSGL